MRSLVHVTDVSPYRLSDARPDDQHRLAGVHGVLTQSVGAMAELSSLLGLRFVHVHDVAELDTATIARARVVCLFTIGETPWTTDQQSALRNGIRAGEIGFLPLHSTSATCEAWPEFGSLVGARFVSHPWTQEFTAVVVDHDHPATRHLGEFWRIVDEVYVFRDLRPDAHVLLRARADDLEPSESVPSPPEVLPLAWCFAEGQGRVLYSALGHFPALYEDERYLGHLYGSLRWVLGDDELVGT